MQDTHRTQDAPEREQDMERHEREAQRREAEERPPGDRPSGRPPEPDTDEEKPAPPGPANQPRG
jgi:hypothetical protein